MAEAPKVNRCLVLGGGGVAGIAWMTGLLHALDQSEVDLSRFGLLVGTSAGSAVGAQLLSGLPLAELLQRQAEPDHQVAELVPSVSKLRLVIKLLPALLARKRPEVFRRRIGRMARGASTVAPADRYRVIEERLPSHEWSGRALKIVAVDAGSGEMVVFDRDSGVSLTDAVAASCAVPGIWPAVAIGDDYYIDGGIRSATNADLASGSSVALILAPMGYHSFLSTESHLKQEVAALEAAGTRVLVITPDEASTRAIGSNPLDPATRVPSAQAGQQQGQGLAGEVARLLAS